MCEDGHEHAQAHKQQKNSPTYARHFVEKTALGTFSSASPTNRSIDYKMMLTDLPDDLLMHVATKLFMPRDRHGSTEPIHVDHMSVFIDLLKTPGQFARYEDFLRDAFVTYLQDSVWCCDHLSKTMEMLLELDAPMWMIKAAFEAGCTLSLRHVTRAVVHCTADKLEFISHVSSILDDFIEKPDMAFVLRDSVAKKQDRDRFLALFDQIEARLKDDSTVSE